MFDFSSLLCAAVVALALPLAVIAQESPCFVTYDHHMEEPGTLDVSLNPMAGSPKHGSPFLSSSLELEYGAREFGYQRRR